MERKRSLFEPAAVWIFPDSTHAHKRFSSTGMRTVACPVIVKTIQGVMIFPEWLTGNRVIIKTRGKVIPCQITQNLTSTATILILEILIAANSITFTNFSSPERSFLIDAVDSKGRESNEHRAVCRFVVFAILFLLPIFSKPSTKMRNYSMKASRTCPIGIADYKSN